MKIRTLVWRPRVGGHFEIISITFKIQNMMQREVQDCLRKVESQHAEMKQEFDSIHEK